MIYAASAVTEKSHSWSYLGLPRRGNRKEFHVIRPAPCMTCVTSCFNQTMLLNMCESRCRWLGVLYTEPVTSVWSNSPREVRRPAQVTYVLLSLSLGSCGHFILPPCFPIPRQWELSSPHQGSEKNLEVLTGTFRLKPWVSVGRG